MTALGSFLCKDGKVEFSACSADDSNGAMKKLLDEAIGEGKYEIHDCPTSILKAPGLDPIIYDNYFGKWFEEKADR
jgi:hypothetical protein